MLILPLYRTERQATSPDDMPLAESPGAVPSHEPSGAHQGLDTAYGILTVGNLQYMFAPQLI